MKIKYVCIIIIHLFLNTTYAQFSLKTETTYLKQVNQQHDNSLIEDNLVSTFSILNELIINDTAVYGADFIIELSKSYQLLDYEDYAFYLQLLQRCLYPLNKVYERSKHEFFELGHQMNVPVNTLKNIGTKLNSKIYQRIIMNE